jgi:peroxiredoxin
MKSLLIRTWLASAVALLVMGSQPAGAVLALGTDAPDFITEAALSGKPFKFSLTDALKNGPVVVYFYPKAFTSGCTVEAHLFAEATERFKALGARVIGISNDDIEVLKKFSVTECRNQFAVGADQDQKIMKAYDAKLIFAPGMADRVSYVITPDHKVLYVYSAMSPEHHVENTLKALEDWRAKQKP